MLDHLAVSQQIGVGSTQDFDHVSVSRSGLQRRADKHGTRRCDLPAGCGIDRVASGNCGQGHHLGGPVGGTQSHLAEVAAGKGRVLQRPQFHGRRTRQRQRRCPGDSKVLPQSATSGECLEVSFYKLTHRSNSLAVDDLKHCGSNVAMRTVRGLDCVHAVHSLADVIGHDLVPLRLRVSV